MGAKRGLLAALYSAAAITAAFSQEAVSAAEKTGNPPSDARDLAAAIAVGVSALASGYAVAKIGAAAIGAMAQKPELARKSLPYLAIGEGICLWGFLVALLILFF